MAGIEFIDTPKKVLGYVVKLHILAKECSSFENGKPQIMATIPYYASMKYSLNQELLGCRQESKTNNFLNTAVVAYFLAYALYQTAIFFHFQALVPDEIAFFNTSVAFKFLLREAPPYNYGSVYWMLLHLLGHLAAVRIVFLLLFLAIPMLLLLSLEKPYQRALGLLLYLSFPAAFWTGKLIGPEILSVFLLCLALYCRKKGGCSSAMCWLKYWSQTYGITVFGLFRISPNTH